MPHRETGEAALDVRGEQERRCRGTCCRLRAIQLLHDERRLLGKLAVSVLFGVAIPSLARLDAPQVELR